MNKRHRALQRAVRLIQRDDCRVLAVKLEVLLPLPLWQEEDLYALMEGDVRRTAQLSGPVDFSLLRMQAKGRTLQEQYDDLSTRLIGANVRSLAERERALRMRLPVLMRDVYSLMCKARKAGKRVVLWGAWPQPLTGMDVAQMLEDRQAEQPDGMYFEHWGAEMNASGTLVLSDVREPSCQLQVTVPSPVESVRQLQTPHEALRYLGFRTMLAASALHPSVEEADPDAYRAFGMYLMSNAMWLADECCRGGIDRVNFLARDGFWVKAAFERVCEALHLPLEAGYVRISRQAVFPLHFRSSRDLLSLPLLTDMTAHTPRTLLALFGPAVDQAYAALVLRQWGFDLDERFNGETLWRFIDVFRERLYDQALSDAYRSHAGAYLSPFFQGRCATFDVGYNLRAESVLQEVTGVQVHAFITHTDSDLAARRGVEYRTLLGGTPWVSWVAREQFLLEDAPLCTGYDAGGPILAAERPAGHPAMTAFKQQALAFVEDMARIFGEDLAQLSFRPEDGCAPFETFLLTAPSSRMRELVSPVENRFLEGNGAGDDTFLQWRLMQTDAGREPLLIRKLHRAVIRLLHSPRTLVRRIAGRFTARPRRE